MSQFRILRKDPPVWALFGDLSDHTILEIYSAVARTPESPLFLLHSPGGDPHLTAGVCAELLRKYPTLEIRVVGYCASAAVDLLQIAPLRTAYPSASFLTHPTQLEGSFSRHTGPSALRRLRTEDDRALAFYATRTGRPARFWRNWFRTERYFSAEEAHELGLLDTILDSERAEQLVLPD